MTGDLLVDVRNLTKVYKDFWGRPQKTAVQDLSFNLKKGEVLGLIGPNGSGKTTTIKVLLGLLRPTQGSVRLFDSTPQDIEVKERLGFLPEESYLYKFLTPKETLLFFGRLFNLPKKILQERIELLLEEVGLSKSADFPVKGFSKGMSRRLGIAQAMINDPELLIFDEPTSGLDPLGTREVKDLILRQKAQGKSVLVCSHLLADLESVCDRVAMLYEGELCLFDSVKNLLEEEERFTLTYQHSPDEDEDRCRQLLLEAGAQDIKLQRSRKTLEQLFLDIVSARTHLRK